MKSFAPKIDWLKLAVCLIFVATPIESVVFSFWGYQSSIVTFSSYILFITWALCKFKIDVNSMIKTFLIMAFYCLVSVIWAINPEYAFNRLFTFLLPTILCCAIISRNLRKSSDFKMIMLSYLIGCVILSIYAFINREEILIAAEFGDMERLSALGQDQNEMATLLNVGIGILLIYLGSKTKKTAKIISCFAVLFFSFIVLSTGSRTGLISLLAMLIIFAYEYKGKYFILIPLIICAGIFIFKLLPEGIIERLMQTENSIRSGDMSNRVDIWRKGIYAFEQENMMLGVGYMNWNDMMIKYYGYRAASHNTYLSAVVCLGIIGAISFYAILTKTLKASYEVGKITKNLSIFLVVAPIFISMFSLETQYRRWLFLLAIIVFCYHRTIKDEQIDLNFRNLAK